MKQRVRVHSLDEFLRLRHRVQRAAEKTRSSDRIAGTARSRQKRATRASQPIVLECKRRWKTIRDRYIRERRLCQLRKEEGGRRLHYWPHRETLAFLDAHIRKRKRPGEAEAPEELDDSPDDSSGAESKPGPEKEKESKQQLKPLSQLPLSIVTQLPPVKPVPPLTQLLLAGLPLQASASTPAPLTVTTSTTPPAAACNLNGKLEENEALKSCEKERERAFDEDELFLLSYVPALKRLTPQKRAAVKMQIQQIMFDAEFKEH
uniref:BESS domain-containing protein n=1 Tax=Cyprinus carpio carpio TaxID=630221 RepID=A0A9J8BFW3_CYPCA